MAQQEHLEQSIREVYDACFGRLTGWVQNLTGDTGQAHEIVAESFISLFRQWDSVDDPVAWVYAAAANRVREYWRKQGRNNEPTPELSARGAVESLPQRLRMPVLLHYYADLSIGRTAKQLRRSEAGVKRELSDARKNLAGYLGSDR